MAAVLPEDLIVEIFLRLPVKSLLRFKCLSKSLCALIESSDFINSRSSRPNFNQHKLIFVDNNIFSFHLYVYDVNFDVKEDILYLENPVSSKWKLIDGGYCKGLLLLYRSLDFCFTLWNPSIRQYRKLPDFPVPPNIVKSVIGVGLGYDDSTHDYKTFCIVQVCRKIEPKLEDQVWVYGLKSNIWRRAPYDFPYNYDDIMGNDCGCFTLTDGSLHWLFSLFHDGTWEQQIVSFDIRKETFSLVPPPACPWEEGLEYPFLISELLVLEGCLCMSYFDSYFGANLYMRKKDGVDRFTWTQLYSVNFLRMDCLKDSFVNKFKVIGNSKKGGKILFNLFENGMVSYDLKNESLTKVHIDDKQNLSRRSTPIVYIEVESLVSLGCGGAL